MSNLSLEKRIALLNDIDDALKNNHLDLGKAIVKIRKELYQMTQKKYAQFVGVSEKTLRDLEKGNTDPRLSILNKVLAPGGLRVSGVRVQG